MLSIKCDMTLTIVHRPDAKCKIKPFWHLTWVKIWFNIRVYVIKTRVIRVFKGTINNQPEINQLNCFLGHFTHLASILMSNVYMYIMSERSCLMPHWPILQLYHGMPTCCVRKARSDAVLDVYQCARIWCWQTEGLGFELIYRFLASLRDATL